MIGSVSTGLSDASSGDGGIRGDIVESNNGTLERVRIKVSGMTCGCCEAAVRDALEDLEGVASVRVSYRTGVAEIRFDAAKASVDQMVSAISDGSGFRAERPTP